MPENPAGLYPDNPFFDIRQNPVIFVITALLAEQCGTDERRLMVDAAVDKEIGVNGSRHFVHLSPAQHVAVQNVRTVTAAAAAENLLQNRFVAKGIAAVHEIQPFSPGAGDAFVHGVVNSVIRFGNQHVNTIPVFVQHIQRAVGRTAVDHDPLKILPALADNAFTGFANVFFIIAYGNNRQFHTNVSLSDSKKLSGRESFFAV